MENLNYQRLKGEGFFLSPKRTDDEALKTYLKWMCDESFLHFLHRNNKVINFDYQLEYHKKTFDPNEYHFNIILVENDEEILVGNCDIRIHNPFVGDANIGIVIGEEIGRDKGLGTKVLKLLVKYGFEELNLHRMNLTLNSDNVRALKCYQNAGFVECGRGHETHFSKGHYTDTIYMEYLAKDYFQHHN